MTICNMSIEAGARAGIIAPDETTFAYLMDRPQVPRGAAWRPRGGSLEPAVERPGRPLWTGWSRVNAAAIAPQVTWGTSPGMVGGIDGRVPDPAGYASEGDRQAVTRALEYMGLVPGTPIEGIPVDRCSLAAAPMRGSTICAKRHGWFAAARFPPRVRAMVVPGSMPVKAQAEREGLDRIFLEAGFEWRNAGCSMCLGMNPDILDSGERCASTPTATSRDARERAGGPIW